MLRFPVYGKIRTTKTPNWVNVHAVENSIKFDYFSRWMITILEFMINPYYASVPFLHPQRQKTADISVSNLKSGFQDKYANNLQT